MNLNPTHKDACRLFLGTAMGILVVTGLVKAISALGNVRVLNLPDPLFEYFSQRQMLLGAAVLELMVVGGLWQAWRKKVYLVEWVLWLSVVFTTYRFGLWLVDYQGPCSCLGRATAWLHISANTGDLLMKGLLGYMLLGSSLLLVTGRMLVQTQAREQINTENR